MSNNQLILTVWTLIVVFYAVYKFTAWREWLDWLNPWNFTKGIVDGRVWRAKEEANLKRDMVAAAQAKGEKEWVEANARINERMAELSEEVRTKAALEMPRMDTRRAGRTLRTACAPDAEFLRRYGSPKTMTLKTLEKLIAERKAAKDAEFEEGF